MHRIPKRSLHMGSAVLFSAVVLLVAAGWHSGDPAMHDGTLQWKSYADALRDSRLSGRKVLIDVYTNWCGWCKKMDRDVYADTAVIRLLSERFELVKLNAESTTTHEIDGTAYSEKAIAQGYGVTGYPTTVFLTGSGDPITSVPGYIPRDTFLDIIDYVGSEAYKSTSWKDYQKTKSGR